MAELEEASWRSAVNTPNDHSHTPTSELLEYYRLAVEMADRISARRSTANSFFLTIQTALIAVLGTSFPKITESPWWASLVVSLAGVVLSASWWILLRSYRDLNKAKFAVINSMEKSLPVRVFADEWESLKTDSIKGWRRRYAELGTVERVIPGVFAILHITLFLGGVTT